MKRIGIALGILLLLIVGFLALSRAEQIFRYSDAIAILLLLLVIIVEVILAPVPGGIISFLGAAHFGFWKAWPVLYLGNVVGSSIAFWLAKRYGTPIIDKMTKPEKKERYDKAVHGRRATLWLMYSVPIFPIDLVSFLCGFSKLKYKEWLPIMATGMLVFSLIVSVIGAFFGQFIPYLGWVSVVVLILFLTVVVWFIISLKRG